MEPAVTAVTPRRRALSPEAPRTDRDAWHEIRHADRPHVSRLRYGDPRHPPRDYVTRPVGVRQRRLAVGRPPLHDRPLHHLVKAPYGRQYDDANGMPPGSSPASPHRGAAASAGEEWLCVRGRASGPGQPLHLEQGRDIQHMAFVARGSGR
ncbi:hypothetical protein GCM10023238_06330 [Streptomyces heliomycini]